MSKIGWRFPLLGDGNETGYANQGIEGYKGKDLIDNLTREICQNSLDAKNKKEQDKPVIVEFKLISIDQNRYELFDEYRECLEGCKEYWQERMDDKLKMFVKTAEETLKHSQIPVLVASDYNTTGLTGSRKNNNEKSIWRGLVQSDGTSVKSGDSAGSYGIGKNAPFACSSLSMVLYNTYAIDELHAFQGVARLATLMQNNRPTQSIGHYKVIDQEIGKPITENDYCPIRDLFKREKYGTDVVIVGFTQPDSWEDDVIKAAIKNFFLAIYEDKLIVRVNNHVISSDTLDKMFEKYKPNDKKLAVSYEMYKAVTSDDREQYTKEIYNSDVEMYLRVDPSYSRNIGYFRNSGMLVGQRRKNKLEKFSMVVVICGESLGSLLKDAEPSKHNRWDPDIISDPNRKKEARRAIKEINGWIDEILETRFKMSIDKSIDADVGEFLPDELDDMLGSERGEGKDKLKVFQKISDIRELSVMSQANFDANRMTGTPIAGNPHNSMTANIITNHPPSAVDGADQGDTSGVGKKQGPKNIILPKVLGQRVIPRDATLGNYVVKIKLEENSDNIYLQFATIGEDNKSERINIKTYVANGRIYRDVNANKIGPISAKANELLEISVVMNNNEKNLINLIVTDER